MKCLRMGVLILFGIVLTFTGCTTTASPQQSTDIQNSLETMLETKYSLFRTEYAPPDELGMLLFLQTPHAEYSVQTGFLGNEYDENTHYRIASVSKTFTAAAIMLLDQQGALDIEDVVTSPIPLKGVSYLPQTEEFAIPYKDQMTIKDLLSHRAGVFDVFNEPIPSTSKQPYAGMNYIEYIMNTESEEPHEYSLEELTSVIAKDQLTYGVPDSLYHYSDSGYMLLAVIIERVSGMSYSEFVEEHFFKPLGLNHTFSIHQAIDTGLPDPHFKGYVRWDADYFERTQDNMTSNIGAGNIISSPRDMAHWIKSLLTGQSSLSPQQVERMKTIPQGNTSYGLGLFGTTVGIGHSGAHPGYLNFVLYNEEQEVALVIVAPFTDYNEGNMDRIAAVSELMMDSMEAALDILAGD